MLNKNIKERYIWLVFLIGSIFLWKVIIPAQIHTNQNTSNIGPDYFPNILSIIIIFISGFSFVKTFINKEKNDEEGEKPEEQGKIIAGIIVFAITIGYTYIIDIIHFVPASIICMFLIMWVLTVRKWYLYVIMLVLVFCIKYIFEDIMYIKLP